MACIGHRGECLFSVLYYPFPCRCSVGRGGLRGEGMLLGGSKGMKFVERAPSDLFL